MFAPALQFSTPVKSFRIYLCFIASSSTVLNMKKKRVTFS